MGSHIFVELRKKEKREKYLNNVPKGLKPISTANTEYKLDIENYISRDKKR